MICEPRSAGQRPVGGEPESREFSLVRRRERRSTQRIEVRPTSDNFPSPAKYSRSTSSNAITRRVKTDTGHNKDCCWTLEPWELPTAPGRPTRSRGLSEDAPKSPLTGVCSVKRGWEERGRPTRRLVAHSRSLPVTSTLSPPRQPDVSWRL